MKYKKQKGEYGYRDSHRRLLSLEVAFGCAMILIQLLARNLTDDQNMKNILTVMAILSVLPTANIASPLIASWRYRTSSKAFYQTMAVYEGRFTVLYDLIITSRDFIMPMDAIVVVPGGIYAYCTSLPKKFDEGQAELFFKEMLSRHKLDFYVKIIAEEQTFLNSLDCPGTVPEASDHGSVLSAVKLLKSMSM